MNDSKFTCEACCKPALPGGIRCRACAIIELDFILSSPEWQRTRGQTAGDLPGETLSDTLRRERAQLTAGQRT